MAVVLNDRLKAQSPEKDNYDRLMSVFHIGTYAKRCLLELFIKSNKLDLLDWLTNIGKHFIQFEDVKKALKRSSIVTPADLGLNTIDIILKYNCFDMFWNCCLLNTNLEDILNKHKKELNSIYQNSTKQTEFSSSSVNLTCTKLQWELLFESKQCVENRQEENVDVISASKGITVSNLDTNLSFLILYIVCPVFKAVYTISEFQIRISKIAARENDMHIRNRDFDDIWNNMEINILVLGKQCQMEEQFRNCCATTKCKRVNQILAQGYRKCVLKDPLDNHDIILVSIIITQYEFVKFMRIWD